MLRVIRGLALALALACLALLPLVALNLTHVGVVEIKRFREITWALYAALAAFALARRDRGAFAARWTSRLRAILSHPRFFPAASLTMLALYVLAALTQHWSFRTFSHDFSMIDQALVPRADRPPLYAPLLSRSFLSGHFSPILFPLVPLHALIRSPYLLVLLQPLALWAAVLPLRKILKGAGVPVATANLACLVYLNHPIQIATLSYLFHMECFLPVLLFLAFRCYQGRSWWLCAGALLLTLAVKEDVGVYLLGFAAYAALVDRKRAFGVATAAVGVAWVALAIKLGMPQWGGMVKGYPLWVLWRAWGEGPWGVAVGFATHPFQVLAALLAWPYVKFFALLLFVPFFRRSAVLLFLIPWLVPATSGYAQQRDLGLYYGLPLLAFAALAGALGLASSRFQRLAGSRWAPYLASAVIALNIAHLSYPKIPRSRPTVLRELSAVPKDARLEAMSCFFPVLGYSRVLSLIQDERDLSADYAVLRSDGTPWPLQPGTARRIVDRALASGSYQDLSTVEGFHILRRVKPAPPP